MTHMTAPALPGASTGARSQPAAGSALQGNHDLYQEGPRLGLIIGTVTWLWLLVVDMLIGQPFHAFNVLGGVIVFTAIHYALNIIYGVALVWAIHGITSERSLAIGLIFLGIIIQTGFAMVTILLGSLALGDLAWLEIFAGSLLGNVVALAVLARTHPLLVQLHEAEAEV